MLHFSFNHKKPHARSGVFCGYMLMNLGFAILPSGHRLEQEGEGKHAGKQNCHTNEAYLGFAIHNVLLNWLLRVGKALFQELGQAIEPLRHDHGASPWKVST